MLTYIANNINSVNMSYSTNSTNSTNNTDIANITNNTNITNTTNITNNINSVDSTYSTYTQKPKYQSIKLKKSSEIFKMCSKPPQSNPKADQKPNPQIQPCVFCCFEKKKKQSQKSNKNNLTKDWQGMFLSDKSEKNDLALAVGKILQSRIF